MLVFIEAFEPVIRDSLMSFARVRLPNGMDLHDVQIHRRGADAWASPASKLMLGRDGAAIGRAKYTAVVTFALEEPGYNFSSAVIEAVRRAYPRALA